MIITSIDFEYLLFIPLLVTLIMLRVEMLSFQVRFNKQARIL